MLVFENSSAAQIILIGNLYNEKGVILSQVREVKLEIEAIAY